MKASNSLCRSLVLAGLTLLTVGNAARAATLASYDFEAGRPSTDTDPTSLASSFSYVDEAVLFSIEPGVGHPGSAARAVTRFNTLNDAKLHDAPMVFTLTPAPGYALNLDTFTSDLAADSAFTPNLTVQLFAFTSLDNYADPIHFNLATDATPNGTTLSPGAYATTTSPGMSFNPGLYHNVTTPVEFRLFYLGTGIETAFLDNVRIGGTTSLVPEPAALAGVGGWIWAARRRRLPRA